jgi:signal peptidase I
MSKRDRKPSRADTTGMTKNPPFAKAATFAVGATSSQPAVVSATGGLRDNIEQLLIALVLALLFRSFEAEAFVIPTGSMAPTLVGRHHDIYCEQCRNRFQSGNSLDAWERKNPLASVTCPLCRFETALENRRSSHNAFSGDRILVNKYVYEFSDPERWDVIVFKFPGNAKQNYIKRLVGLPKETLRIANGDLYVKGLEQADFKIARKSPEKLQAMMQLVHDTEHIPSCFVRLGWPSAWFPGGESTAANGWKVSANQNQFSFDEGGEKAWLMYRNLLPTSADWNLLEQGRLPESVAQRSGELVTDYYAYNATKPMGSGVTPSGWHWVGDLAVEADITVQSEAGDVWLDLVEGGTHFQCHIDVSTGACDLTMEGGKARFERGASQTDIAQLEGQSGLKGPGKYQVRYANCDHQIRLWINGNLVPWKANQESHEGGYETTAKVVPRWTAEDSGDLNPIRVGARGVKLLVRRLQVFRDLYYVATSSDPIDPSDPGIRSPYQMQCEYRPIPSFDDVRRIMQTPSEWATTTLFDDRQQEEFSLDEDQFLPMGDNSPFSYDGRLWERHHSVTLQEGKLVGNYVTRDLLIGKAFLIYWPHGWNLGPVPLPIVPNVSRMERIK